MGMRTEFTPSEVQAVIDAVPDELQPLPGTVALIERLGAAGHVLHYLSNMPQPFAAHLESAYPMHRWFRDGVFSSRVGVIKPDPAIFALAQQRLGLAPAATLFIDDSQRNVAAARAAGWQALHFTEASALEADLRAGGWL